MECSSVEEIERRKKKENENENGMKKIKIKRWKKKRWMKKMMISKKRWLNDNGKERMKNPRGE